MTTACTICSMPCTGEDSDDSPCCAWCEAANLAGAMERPPASVTRAFLRVVGSTGRQATHADLAALRDWLEPTGGTGHHEGGSER